LKVSLFELAEIAQKDIKRDRDMFLVEACREHLVHKIVDLIDRVEVDDRAAVGLRPDLVKIAELCSPHVFILDH